MTIYDPSYNELLTVTPDDSSYRYRAIMGDDTITLNYSLPHHVELPLGSMAEYQGRLYTLLRPSAFKMQHSREFDYTVTLEADSHKAALWKFCNPVDGRIKFSLTARPKEHLDMLITILNTRDGGWTAGECVDDVEKTVNYDNANCLEALAQMADAFGTEYEFDGQRVSLHRVEYNSDAPLALSYGKGNGLKGGIARANEGDLPPVGRLYVQGGERNIDPSAYKSQTLRLPASVTVRYDGRHFDWEQGYGAEAATAYTTDKDGRYVEVRSGEEEAITVEDSLDCSDIYPSREGTVTEAITVDAAKNFYDFTDSSIPPALDFSECLIEGETMTVIFQSGMLAGREFDVKYHHEATGGKKARRFEIVPQEMDGQTMPGGNYLPKKGDKYAVFHCALPQAYIRDDATHSGASWDMLKAAVLKLHTISQATYSYTAALDGIWAAKDWENIGGKVRLGGYVLFTDPSFERKGAKIRITGIKDYLNRPHRPEIELSNQTSPASYSTQMRQLESQLVGTEGQLRQERLFTLRRWRDAKETMQMLESSLLEGFTNSVSPIAVQTMQLLAGDESLQFRFVTGKDNPQPTAWAPSYDDSTKVLDCPAGVIQHLTLGIGSISPQHAPSEYRFWSMAGFTSAVLDDPAKGYYLYARCRADTAAGKAGQGTFRLSASPVKMGQEAGFYHFLVGILSSEQGGRRSFAPLYGLTEVLPGQITTGRIVSQDGRTYFDLDANEIGGRIIFRDGLVSGLVGAGEGTAIRAGINGQGTGGGAVRFWAGAAPGDKEAAPFRVTDDGKLTATDGEFGGTVNAIDGTIGGFKIGPEAISSVGKAKLSIGVENFSTQFGITETVKNVTVQNGITSSVPMAVPFSYRENNRLTLDNPNTANQTDWKNIAVANVMDMDYFRNNKMAGKAPDRRYGYQYAMLGSGHVCMDGMVEGACLDVEKFTQAGQVVWVQPPMWCNRIALNPGNYENCVAVLPDKWSMLATIGCGIVGEDASRPFSFMMTFINTSTGTAMAYVSGRTADTVGGHQPFKGADFPQFYENSGRLLDSLTSCPVAANGIVQVMLVYDGTDYKAIKI